MREGPETALVEKNPERVPVVRTRTVGGYGPQKRGSRKGEVVGGSWEERNVRGVSQDNRRSRNYTERGRENEPRQGGENSRRVRKKENDLTKPTPQPTPHVRESSGEVGQFTGVGD